MNPLARNDWFLAHCFLHSRTWPDAIRYLFHGCVSLFRIYCTIHLHSLSDSLPSLEPHSLWRLRGLLQDFDAIAERIEQLDRRVERAFADHRRTLDMLETLPGVARCSAHAILAELGPEPTKVFPKVRSLTAWAGLCPGNNESAGKRRSGRIRRGNPMLRVTLTECAHGAARTKGSQFHGYHRALTARFGYKRALPLTQMSGPDSCYRSGPFDS